MSLIFLTAVHSEMHDKRYDPAVGKTEQRRWGRDLWQGHRQVRGWDSPRVAGIVSPPTFILGGNCISLGGIALV